MKSYQHRAKITFGSVHLQEGFKDTPISQVGLTMRPTTYAASPYNVLKCHALCKLHGINGQANTKFGPIHTMLQLHIVPYK